MRKDERGPCLCAGGTAPDAHGECPSAACNAPADQAAIRAALKQAEATAKERCHATSPSTNSGSLTVTLAPNGHVVEASIEGALAGTEAARCVRQAFLEATVTCFGGEPVKLKKNIALP